MHSADDKPRKEEFNKVDWAVSHTPRVSYYLLWLDTLCANTLALLATVSSVLLSQVRYGIFVLAIFFFPLRLY